MRMSDRQAMERKQPQISKKQFQKKLIDYLIITFAAFVYAVAVSLFLDPNSLAPGGVTGISIILNRVVDIDTGYLILLINIPILVLGIWKFGIKFILSTIYCIFMSSMFTNLLSPYGALTEDPILASIAGASLMAFALGTVFKRGGTTGGTDIIVKILRLRYPYLKTGFFFLAIDMIIVIFSGIVFRNVDKALYAMLVVFMTSFILDLVLYGRDGAKLIFIISDHADRITERLLDELEIGVTYVQGFGAYSGKEKNVIMCVIRKHLAHKAENIVKEEDSMAFMIVSSATEIYGVGYKSYFSEKL